MLEKELNKGDFGRNYRSCVNTTMSCKGHHTKCWVITQPIKEVSPSPLVGEGARRAGEGFFCGFTLIELLVVVLIIGILAAVALPQYQRAVKKANFVQLMVAGDAMYKAQKVYYLAHGEYAENKNVLDVEIQAPKNGYVSVTKLYIDVASTSSGLSYLIWLGSGKRACRVMKGESQTEPNAVGVFVCQSLTGSNTANNKQPTYWEYDFRQN